MTRARTRGDKSGGLGATDAAQLGATALVSSSTEFLSLVKAAEEIFGKLRVLCVRQSSEEKVHPTSEIDPTPKYVDEKRVAEITGMSRVWFQRARGEGIGPPWYKIGRHVAYPLAEVVHWIESGAAAREHLTSSRAKKPRPMKLHDDTEPAT